MAYKVRGLLAQRIRALREERGWSQEDLAEASGLHRTYIGAIERSERNMGIDNLENFAKAFKIPIADLFRE
jgi:transcriptional regulator with XRE-family HTH domain